MKPNISESIRESIRELDESIDSLQRELDDCVFEYCEINKYTERALYDALDLKRQLLNQLKKGE